MLTYSVNIEHLKNAYVFDSKRLNLLKEWIIDQFLLQGCQKKHNEWSYNIF